MKQIPNIRLVFNQSAVCFVYILELNHPTRQIYTNPFVPKTQQKQEIQKRNIKLWSFWLPGKIKEKKDENFTGDGEAAGSSCMILRCPISSLLPCMLEADQRDPFKRENEVFWVLFQKTPTLLSIYL